MNVTLFVGSPRARSNTRSIMSDLKKRLEHAGACVVILDPQRDEEASEAFAAHSISALREVDALVLASPVYLDLPPFKTLSWLHAMDRRQEELVGVRPMVYAVSHSGYFDRIHKQVSLRAFEHLCQRMGWTWCGGLAFGGTSPIDGRSLSEAGPFSRRIRPALDALCDAIMRGSEIPQRAVSLAGRSPLPLPRHLVVWLMNRVLKKG